MRRLTSLALLYIALTSAMYGQSEIAKFLSFKWHTSIDSIDIDSSKHLLRTSDDAMLIKSIRQDHGLFNLAGYRQYTIRTVEKDLVGGKWWTELWYKNCIEYYHVQYKRIFNLLVAKYGDPVSSLRDLEIVPTLPIDSAANYVASRANAQSGYIWRDKSGNVLKLSHTNCIIEVEYQSSWLARHEEQNQGY